MAVFRQPEATLSAATTYLLLTGRYDRVPTGEDSAWDDLYFDGTKAAARLWRTHERFLRAEAGRLGIEPTSGPQGNEFFAEHCALTEPRG